MMRSSVVLLSRGGYSDAPKQQLDGLVKRLESTGKYQSVVGAFVDQAMPSLPQALGICAESGAEQILVVPVYVPDDRHLGKWLLKVIRRWLARWTGSEVQVVVSGPLGDHPFMADAVARLVSEAGQGEPISLDGGSLEFGEPEWSLIPPHKYHLLQCRGPRCTAQGSGDVWDHLNGRLLDEGLLDKHVLVAQTGCLYPCNLGPMMVVYPEGVWYCGMNEAAADKVVDEHFLGGQVVGEHARWPEPHAQRRPGSSV
ncbi:MAG: hypothetical protein O2821_06095 [Chloroflexi bacterium]|nr:hypothetical protein [Chloroflexota bacterium]